MTLKLQSARLEGRRGDNGLKTAALLRANLRDPPANDVVHEETTGPGVCQLVPSGSGLVAVEGIQSRLDRVCF